MHDRLKQFLTMEGLSPARFAEVMGIQRSGISHLLAGRNKPSFDRPLPEKAENETLFTETEESDPDLEADLLPEDQTLESQNPASQPAENRIFVEESARTLPENRRKIARIIVFYNDGTYEEK